MFRNSNGDLVLLPLAAHQHLARADGVLGLPDAEVVPRLPAPRPHRRVLRLLRRPLRLPRPDPLRRRRRARRARRRTAASTCARATARPAATTRSSSPTATTGIRAGRSPPFPGSDTFEGEQIHSHDYKEETQLAGRDVVVLGMGNSAMDIAVDASYHAEEHRTWPPAAAPTSSPSTSSASRVDRIGAADHLPATIRFPIMAAAAQAHRSGKMTRLRAARARPQVRARPPDGQRPHPRPPRPRRDHRRSRTSSRSRARPVRFVDGTEVHADLVVYCTGYKITFPFFDEGFVSAARQRDAPLPAACSTPSIDGLFFPGLDPAARRDHADRRAPGRC